MSAPGKPNEENTKHNFHSTCLDEGHNIKLFNENEIGWRQCNINMTQLP